MLEHVVECIDYDITFPVAFSHLSGATLIHVPVKVNGRLQLSLFERSGTLTLSSLLVLLQFWPSFLTLGTFSSARS